MKQPATQNICPKCGKGQIVCTYLGEDKPRHHRWAHDCTNPACNLREAYDCLDTDIDDYNEHGPDKEGGCPGHK